MTADEVFRVFDWGYSEPSESEPSDPEEQQPADHLAPDTDAIEPANGEHVEHVDTADLENVDASERSIPVVEDVASKPRTAVRKVRARLEGAREEIHGPRSVDDRESPPPPADRTRADWEARGFTVIGGAESDGHRSEQPDAPAKDAETFGCPFLDFVGQVEPDDNPADVFEANGLIVRAEPSLIIGDPKVGKTLTVEDLALHLAAGRKEWCGVPLYRRCRVLLFLREDSARTSIRRLWQLARGAGIEHWELAEHLLIDATSPLYFDDAKLTAKLQRQLESVDICVIDSLSTIHNADENSVERMAPVMNRWRDLSLTTKTALPLVHHFRKRGENTTAGGGNVLQRARGSSLIAATTRHAVGVERGPNEHELVFSVESNHEVDTEPFVVRRKFGTDDRGRKWITHERVGSFRDALESKAIAQIDPVVLAVVKGASAEGIGARELRGAVIEKLRDERGAGVRHAKVDTAARRLELAGKIEQTGDPVKWRFLVCPGGTRK